MVPQRTHPWGLVVFVFVSGIVSPSATATQRLVPTGYPTLQAAVDASVDGDEVILSPGVYAGAGNRDVNYRGKAITLRSTDPNDPAVVASTIVNCDSSIIAPHRAFTFASNEGANSVLAGLTITNGYEITGGAILCEGASPTILRCRISDCSAQFAGALWNNNSHAVVRGCTFTGNSAVSAGAIWNMGGAVLVDDCLFSGNDSPLGGGGAIVNIDEGEARIENCTFTKNNATFGGAMFNHLADPQIADCTFTENTGGHGGSVYNLSCNPTLRRCTFTRNSSYWAAGVDNYDYSRATLLDCVFEENRATWGGAMVDFGGASSTIIRCVFRKNVADGASGGGICCGGGGSTYFEECLFTENSTTVGSGAAVGIIQGCRPTLVRCRLVNNYSIKNGGAIYSERSSPTIDRCLLAGNTAEVMGGAIIGFDGSSPIIRDSLIVGNAAEYGGGIATAGTSSARLTGCTITNNRGGTAGGGVCAVSGSAVSIDHSILWRDVAGTGPEIAMPDLGGAVVSVAFCDVEGGADAVQVDPNCSLNWGDGSIDADPGWTDPNGPDGDWNTWADNDYHLSADSPCKDTGDPNAVTEGRTDIDGQPRRMGPQMDIGADEFAENHTLSLETVNETWGTVALLPEPEDANLPAYPEGTLVTLTATPTEGHRFGHWEIADPNHPDDPNFALIDANQTTTVSMEADRKVVAVFACGEVPPALQMLSLFPLARLAMGFRRR